ncbi:DUF1801 domain-containing protein [Arthrobacter sp. CAN_A1]|uniref:DUF1801 domain-containing protein n=1 Tax=Arthrobacter sp. CAN_A1 TaxID=2787717 RepID=UPI0018CBD85C
MSEPALSPTGRDPQGFVAAVPHPVRRQDAEVLLSMMTEVTGQPAAMWGPTIVGFGSYHYHYESGREGDAAAVGFSPRTANLVLYGLTNGPASQELLGQLGKHKRGASCLYVNKLADIDLVILRQMTLDGYQHTTRLYNS